MDMKRIIILGADISKGYCDFVLMDAQGQILEPRFRLDDTSDGQEKLSERLRHWRRHYRADRVLLVAESTGGYEDNWLRLSNRASLSDFLETYRVNAKIIYHEYHAQRRSSIDDGVSAQTIALHVAKNIDRFTPSRKAGDRKFAAARSLIRHKQKLEEEATVYKNSLLKLLYQYLPSLEALRPPNWPAYWIEILIRYGSRKSIQMAAKRGFKQIKRVPKGKAKTIAKALENGIDLRETPPFVVMTIQSKARQIKHLNQEINRLEKALIEAAPVEPKQVELLQSIKGIGAYTPVLLLCYIEDINRFENAKKMAAFFGVQPRIKQSGDGAYKARMSKQGAGIVRRELYLLAFRSFQNIPYLKAIYAKARAKAMSHDAALGLLMHKLIRIIYGILKNQTPFDPGIDQLNQQDKKPQVPQSPNTSKPAKAERYQTPGLDAPLSRRKRKQRRKDYASQAALTTECTGST